MPAAKTGRCCMFGDPNYLGSAYATVTAPGYLGDLVPENVQGGFVSQEWHSDQLHPARTRLFFDMLTARRLFGALGVVNVNLRYGDKWRVVILRDAGASGFTDDVVGPSSIQALTNLTGSVGQISDDPFAGDADGSWLAATSHAADTSVRARFSDPSIALAGGADLQVFSARCRASNGGVTTTQVRISLYQAGAVVRVGSWQTLESLGVDPADKVLFFTWTLSELPAPGTLSTVEIRVEGKAVAGPSTVEVAAVAWHFARLADYDTGLLDAFPASMAELFEEEVAEPLPYPLNLRHVMDPDYSISGAGFTDGDLSTTQEASRVMIEFRKAAGGDSFVAAGLTIGGKAWRPRVNFTEGASAGVEDKTEAVELDGGGVRFRPGPRRRVLEFKLARQSRGDIMTESVRRDWIGGKARGRGYILFPDDDDMTEGTFVYGWQPDLSAAGFTRGRDRWSNKGLAEKSFKISELL